MQRTAWAWLLRNRHAPAGKGTSSTRMLLGEQATIEAKGSLLEAACVVNSTSMGCWCEEGRHTTLQSMPALSTCSKMSWWLPLVLAVCIATTASASTAAWQLCEVGRCPCAPVQQSYSQPGQPAESAAAAAATAVSAQVSGESCCLQACPQQEQQQAAATCTATSCRGQRVAEQNRSHDAKDGCSCCLEGCSHGTVECQDPRVHSSSDGAHEFQQHASTGDMQTLAGSDPITGWQKQHAPCQPSAHALPAADSPCQSGHQSPDSQSAIQADNQWAQWPADWPQLIPSSTGSAVPGESSKANIWTLWITNWMGATHLPDSMLPEWARVLRDRMSTRSAFCCMLFSVLLVAYCSYDLLRYSPEDILLLSHKAQAKPVPVTHSRFTCLLYGWPECSMAVHRWLASVLRSCVQPGSNAVHHMKGEVLYKPAEYKAAPLPIKNSFEEFAQRGIPPYVRRRSTPQASVQAAEVAAQRVRQPDGDAGTLAEQAREQQHTEAQGQQQTAVQHMVWTGTSTGTTSQALSQQGIVSKAHMQAAATETTLHSSKSSASSRGLKPGGTAAVGSMQAGSAADVQVVGAAGVPHMRMCVAVTSSDKVAAALAAAKAASASAEAVGAVLARSSASLSRLTPAHNSQAHDLLSTDKAPAGMPSTADSAKRSRRRLVSEVDRGSRDTTAAAAAAHLSKATSSGTEDTGSKKVTRSGSGRSASVPRRAALMSALKMMSSAYSQQQRRQQRQRRSSSCWQGQHMYWLYQPQKPPAPEPERPAPARIPSGDLMTRRRLMLIEVATMLQGSGAASATYPSTNMSIPRMMLPGMMMSASSQPGPPVLNMQVGAQQVLAASGTQLAASALAGVPAPVTSQVQPSPAGVANQQPAMNPGVLTTHPVALQQPQQVLPHAGPAGVHTHIPVAAAQPAMLQPTPVQQATTQLPMQQQQAGPHPPCVVGLQQGNGVVAQPQLPQEPSHLVQQAQLQQSPQQARQPRPHRPSLEEQQQQQAAQLQELAALQQQIQQQQQQILAQQLQGLAPQLPAGPLQQAHQLLGMNQQQLLQALQQQQQLQAGLTVQPQLHPHSGQLNPNMLGMHRIVLLELIGQGASGQVYRGHWRGEDVAVKTVVFREEVAARRDRALLEAAVCQALEHPAVVRTYTYDIMPVGRTPASSHAPHQGDVNTGNQAAAAAAQHQPVDWKLYLVQELCQATLRAALVECVLHDKDTGAPYMVRDSLASVCIMMRLITIREGYGKDTLLPLLLDMASGMEYLHSRSVIHGDLKPENVLLKANPEAACGMTAKITDFGLATVLRDDQSRVINTTAGGTPYYAAPEVVQHGQLTKASDVYSFGVLMWVTYRCLPPWVLTKDGGYAANKLLGKYFIGTPPPYVLLSVRCMSLQPEHRPSFSEVRATLQSMLMCFEAGQPGLHPLPSTAPPNPLLPNL